VGIGTTSADEALEVSGDVKSSGGNFGIYHFGETSDVTKIVGRDASHGSFPNTMDFFTNSTQRMRIDSSGNVGIGTTTVGQFSSTDVGLTVDSGNAYSGIAMTDGATTSTLVQGYSTTYLYNQANGSMLFGTNNTERMRINSSGNLGIGITSPTADLHVRRAADGTESNAHFKIAGGASTYTAHHWLDATAYYIGQSAMSRRVRIYSGAEASGVNLNAGATSWGTFSDERLKYDVEPVENALESLSNLRTVKYRLKDVDSAEDKKKIGLMAQDLVGVLDEVIDPVKKTGDDTEYMSVRYTELVPVLVKAIQEQQTLIESLTARIAALEE
jgi:hypothetical protein